MLHLLWMCLIGLVAGALAKLFMPGKANRKARLTREAAV